MSKKILVVVDVQNDFIHGPLGNKECKSVISNIVNVINNGDYDEIYMTFDTHSEDYLDTQEGKKLPIKHCIAGTEGWALEKNVLDAIKKSKVPIEKKVGIEKYTFGSDELGNIFNAKYGKGNNLSIDFVGVCTGICVISNATIAKAFCPEAEINIIADACACVTPESHETALKAMELLQMNII